MDYEVRAVDTSRRRGSWYEPASRLWSYVRAVALIISGRRVPVLYLAFPDGGEAPLAALLLLSCMARRNPVIVHHHSRKYLSRKMVWITLLKHAERRCSLVHVLQCECLARQYRELYGVDKALPLSNAFSIPWSWIPVHPSVSELVCVGYFGTISASKGFLSFLEIIEPMLSERPELRASAGGKCATSSDRARLADACDRFPGQFSYVGERYGQDKREYLGSLDLLVFPTQYAAETEGIVLLEALSVGTPFVATSLGCIPSVASLGGGVAVPFDELAGTVDRLLSDGALRDRRGQALESFKALAARSRGERDAIVSTVFSTWATGAG